MTVQEQIFKKESEIVQLKQELQEIEYAASARAAGYINIPMSPEQEKKMNIQFSKQMNSIENKIATRERALQKLYTRRANGEL